MRNPKATFLDLLALNNLGASPLYRTVIVGTVMLDVDDGNNGPRVERHIFRYQLHSWHLIHGMSLATQCSLYQDCIDAVVPFCRGATNLQKLGNLARPPVEHVVYTLIPGYPLRHRAT